MEPDEKWNHISTKVKLSITGNLPLVLSGYGKYQEVEFNFNNTIFAIEGRTSGGGFCGSDDIHNLINKVLQKELPEQLKKGINFAFSGFSVFALQNLLFPCRDSIKLKTIYLPADLVLFGCF